MNARQSIAITLGLLALLAAGCSLTPRERRAMDDQARRGVTIRYTLVNRCGTLSLQDGPGTTVGGPDHIFLVYTIDSIENRARQAEDFEFSADPLFVPTDLRNRVFADSQAVRASSVTIPRGGSRSNVGWLVMRYLTNDPRAALERAPETLNSLRYENRGGEQPVLILPSPRRAAVRNLERCNPSIMPPGPRFV